MGKFTVRCIIAIVIFCAILGACLWWLLSDKEGFTLALGETIAVSLMIISLIALLIHHHVRKCRERRGLIMTNEDYASFGEI